VKIASYNLNGIRARLPRLIEWLEREQPDVVCLQELKCADDALPVADIEASGYGAVWHGQKGFNGVAVLAKGSAPALRRVGLPGDPDDSHSRYIEAEVDGVVVASIYLPNGNPVGTEKFDYKLRWLERLTDHAAALLGEERPVVLAGDYNVIPEDRDVFSVRAMQSDALMLAVAAISAIALDFTYSVLLITWILVLPPTILLTHSHTPRAAGNIVSFFGL